MRVSLVGADGIRRTDSDPTTPSSTGLATALAYAGHEVTVLVRAERPGQRSRLTSESGYQLRRIAGTRLDAPHLAELTQALKEHWNRQRPDVVHVRSRAFGDAAQQAADDLELPLVQNVDALGATDSPSSRRQADNYFELAARADRVIVPSSVVKQQITTEGIPRLKIDLVPSGINLTLFDPKVTPIPADPPTRLLAFAALTPQDGIDTLIEALIHLPDARLVIGGGPSAARLPQHAEAQRLRAHARRCGVANRVKLLGRISEAKMPALFAAADIAVCVPWHDAYGQTAMRAMACGLPVVATSVGALADIVVPTATGVLIPPGQVSATVAALRSLIRHPFQAQAFGVSGQVRAATRYGWDRVCWETARCYEQTITGKGRV
ncbi:glycosyltransferase [Pseudonocardiaceae bacterium YIM PH 21723]|nr:glycosyltransferase [Pseudonocardiaceae bacterium YIM PH 21723]